MKKVLALLLVTIISINIWGCNTQQKEIKQVSTLSEIQGKTDMREYYLFACDLCDFMKKQFDILVENYPDRYSVLKDKLNEYIEEMTTIEDENNGEELYIKGNYALIYGEELVALVREKGLDSYVEQDYNLLIEKGIVKDNEG